MGKVISIAIVDDEKDLVTVLEKGFTWHGIEVVFVAYNGYEAVDRYKNAVKRPDVIIMDYAMPGINGLAAARQILALSPGVKIIFLTGQRLEENMALDIGAIKLIRKPASIKTLIDAVVSAA